MVLADPVVSILTEMVNSGRMTQAGSWLVEGIGEDFVPSICDLDLVDKAYAISAHNNNNIVPGAPISGRATLNYSF